MIGASMAVRPPRSRGPVLMMIDALRRIGGSLWMVDNAYTGAFVDNVGTTPVTAVGDLLGLTTDRLGVLGAERRQDFVTGVGGTATAATYNTGTGAGAVTRVDLANQSFVSITGLTATASYRLTLVNTGAVSINVRQLDYAGSTIATIAAGASWSGFFTGHANCVITAGGGTATFTLNEFRRLTGNHASQSAVASKPSVQRVPKRLGPNLVGNGTFDSGTTGWTAYNGGGVSAIGGELVLTNVSAAYGRASFALNTEVGKSYSLQSKGKAGTSGLALIGWGAAFGTAVANQVSTTSATTTQLSPIVFTATSTTSYVVLQTGSITAGQTAIFDNIEVREVLEWANVISFDGSNDFLQTGITMGNEGWICAGVTMGGASGANETVFASGAGNAAQKGVWLLRNSTASALRMGVGNGTALTMDTVTALPLLNVPRVVEGGWAASTVIVGVDGITSSKAKTGDITAPGTALIGAFLGGIMPLQGPMHAIAYTPVLPSAVDCATIRDGIAALQGRTL